jgi:uncharacterized protein (DUF362 family)
MALLLDDPRVALVHDVPSYPISPPYHPSEAYPEWGGGVVGSEDNPAYRAVRQVFQALEMDTERFGDSDWDPLRAIVRPGNTVVLKPNLVSHHNGRGGPWAEACLVTHGSVIRAVLDYVARALRGQGKVLIADCPIQGADWDALTEVVGLHEILRYAQERFPGIDFALADYRLGRAVVRGGAVSQRIVDEAPLSHYREIDLEQRSELIGLMTGNWAFGCAQYSRRRMRAAHTPDTNKYLMHQEFLTADVLINLPKMKSHMKAGMTGAMKNLVGLIGHKDYLPHFRFGSPKQGGDEYPDGNYLWNFMWLLYHLDWERERGPIKRLLYYGAAACQFALRASGYGRGGGTALGGGSWYGNDTVWRTILDINRAFFYCNRQTMRVTDTLYENLRYFAILDGLIGGAKESPLSPSAVESGVMMGAYNPVAMDAVAAAVMGLDARKIPQITQALSRISLPLARFALDDIRIVGHPAVTSIQEVYNQGTYLPFEPSRGFKGFVEYGAHSRAPSSRPALSPGARQFVGGGEVSGLRGGE